MKTITTPADRHAVPDGDILDSQKRILDAAFRWGEQRDIGPSYAKAAWRDMELRVKSELNYTRSIAHDEDSPADGQERQS